MSQQQKQQQQIYKIYCIMMLPLIKNKPSEIHYRLKVSKNTCKSIEQADFFSSGIITGTSPLLLINQQQKIIAITKPDMKLRTDMSADHSDQWLNT